ncbi:glycerol 3-phosphate dehydrogenase (NAD(P)+) [Inmirania thermothiophila]|uniref:Glycerol-3-phosphate dehydrogenase [NAD(P)+] n=1 Tax=Inmirania thermothiophila TaxID=1750597 RepID=A0A3N1Y5Y1_9GAMM|nr:glycerol 3-phosphate dehydrogenase (NAD(P)+) [Inmirania thermothiophila]
MHLARGGHRVRLWGRDPVHLGRLARERANARYLPGVALPEGLEPVAALEAALAGGAEVLVAVPSAGFAPLLEALRPLWEAGRALAWATKGFEHGGERLLHEVVAERLGAAVPVAVVSGPSFAAEVAAGLPTAVTVAGHPEAARAWARRLHHGAFRAYLSDDLVGVEVGGAVKNVMAIAAGVSDGLGFGANARAALVTRGLAEVTRLGLALGGRRETFMGLAGLGDLVLTCTDDQSRNRRLGLALARGAALAEALAGIGQAVEGVATAAAVRRLGARLGVEMPICEQVDRLLKGRCSAQEAVQALLARSQKEEFAGF